MRQIGSTACLTVRFLLRIWAIGGIACMAAGASAAANSPATTTPSVYDIRSFGAVGDGATLNTKAMQTAIDQCSVGGGTVLVSGGRYITGTLYLKSNVNLRVDGGAAILGSANIADYTTDTDRTMYRGEPYMNHCLIFAKEARNISIEGTGTIDGQGKSFPNRRDPQKNRPKLIRLLGCSHIRVSDVTLLNPASWTNEWRYCSDIVVDGISVSSRANSNGDGIDLDGCTDAHVSRSKFDTSDDSVCLQTSMPEHPCRDITIQNCSFSSRWAGVRIGLLSRGDIENVRVNNCAFHDHNDSGLKIQMGEGAAIKNMVFSNLTMKNVPRPVFMTLCQQNAWVDAPPTLPAMGSISDIRFNNITVDTSTGSKGCGFIITGMPGHTLENIAFSDIKASFPGGGSAKDAADVLEEYTPENLKAHWPEYGLLRGIVPSSGLYARHVKGITLTNVEITTKVPDVRPPVVFVDVSDAKVSNGPEPDKR